MSMGAEQGLILPGMTVVCGDSHTATHGAFGSLAFRHWHFGSGACTGYPMPDPEEVQIHAGERQRGAR